MLSKKTSLNNYKESGTFLNKNIIITGVSGAIGSQVTKKLLEYGANIVGFIHNESKKGP